MLQILGIAFVLVDYSSAFQGRDLTDSIPPVLFTTVNYDDCMVVIKGKNAIAFLVFENKTALEVSYKYKYFSFDPKMELIGNGALRARTRAIEKSNGKSNQPERKGFEIIGDTVVLPNSLEIFWCPKSPCKGQIGFDQSRITVQLLERAYFDWRNIRALAILLTAPAKKSSVQKR